MQMLGSDIVFEPFPIAFVSISVHSTFGKPLLVIHHGTFSTDVRCTSLCLSFHIPFAHTISTNSAYFAISTPNRRMVFFFFSENEFMRIRPIAINGCPPNLPFFLDLKFCLPSVSTKDKTTGNRSIGIIQQ